MRGLCSCCTTQKAELNTVVNATDRNSKNDRKSNENLGDFSDEPNKWESFARCKRSESRDEEEFTKHRDITLRVVNRLQNGTSPKKSVSTFSFPPDQIRTKSIAGDGLMLHFPITFEEAELLRSRFCQNGAARAVNYNIALELLEQLKQSISEQVQCAVADVPAPGPGNKLIVVGDTHGQLQDVLFLFHTLGPPTCTNVYLFNGDICDRGQNACEIFFLLAAYHLADPTSVYINRGNHESPQMNGMEADRGGGFYDEVLNKYDSEMYNAFVDVMMVLPLCAVVGQKVFVVHGGLTSQSLTLDFIRSIDYTSNTMPDLGSSDRQDIVWNDLLWSDPQDSFGVKTSPRGCGCMFGPDVTKKFFELNPPIQLIIRSHELPDGGGGHMMHHGRKCVTVFSASNYCGDSGNDGSVLVFTGGLFPSFEFNDYYSPTLSGIAKSIAIGDSNWKTVGSLLKEQQDNAIRRGRALKELHKLMVVIAERKPEIWSHFCKIHPGVSMVDYKTWTEILSAVLGMEWDLETAWKSWKLGRHAGQHVNFVDFLRRFQVVLAKEALMASKFRTAATVYEAFMSSHTSLEDTLGAFDPDGDGNVGMEEMRGALQQFDLGLSADEVDRLLHAIFKNAPTVDGVLKLRVKDLLWRFTIVYKRADNAVSDSAQTEDQRLAHEMMRKIGHIIAITPIDALTEAVVNNIDGVDFLPMDRNGSIRSCTDNDAMIPRKVKCIFEIIDVDHNGYIELDELVHGLEVLPGIPEIRLSDGESLTPERIRRLAKMVCHCGSISVLGLMQAWCCEDTVGHNAVGNQLVDSLAEHTLILLFRYRHFILAGCRYFDEHAAGIVTKDDFCRVLGAVNKEIETIGPSFIEHKLHDLCDSLAITKHGEEVVTYEDFFAAFIVRDVENPTVAVRVRSGKR
eukprot:CAMPEP_0117525688 /NCGR_PEP_ID=MMETSP0784-20121206/35900_1 /TAXON_ID=39447 /ORGANISM="" /LENGTH=905 /DNA_ID=CAMNT_0005321895 /DNA_START=1 /DNA_END=2714 /DNA_ORIENTATION=-